MSVSRAEADLARIEAEMQRLQARIAMLQEQSIRLRHYVEVARVYDGAPQTAMSDVDTNFTSRADVRVERLGGIARLAVSGSIALLRERGQPMHTRVLLEELAGRGINIGGENPVANLSGFLSRARDRLQNSRLTGWSLREWGGTPPSKDVPPTTTGAKDEGGSAAIPSEPVAEPQKPVLGAMSEATLDGSIWELRRSLTDEAAE